MSTRVWLPALALAFGLLAGGAAMAQPPQPFTAGSHAQILAAHKEQPLILAFWSVNCAHCAEELTLLGEVARTHPQVAIVLVSTDTPADAPGIEVMLRKHGLNRAPSWVFADEPPERLRFEVDRRWRGELPRTYLHRPGGAATAVTGKIGRETLARWLER